MSQLPKAPPHPSRGQISHYFTPTLRSTTTAIAKPLSQSSQETTSLTSQSLQRVTKNAKLDSMFRLVGVRKTTNGVKQQLRNALAVKVKCDVKVDPNAPYPRPDVNLTVDAMLHETKKIERNGGYVNLELCYPWLWWQCWFESHSARYSYYEARRNHGVLCSCCENARYRRGFRVVKNLCEDCAADKCHYPCHHLIDAFEERKRYKDSIRLDERGRRRRINVLTTQDVIDFKLQSEVT